MNMQEEVIISSLISRAIKEGLTLQILYEKADGEISNRVISKISISDEYGSGYIRAYCHKRNEERTFKISRILDAQIQASSTAKTTKRVFNYVFDPSKPIFNLYGENY